MLDFTSILSVTHASIVKGNDIDTAARASFPVVIKSCATLADLLREERAGEQVKRGIAAAYRALVAGMRAIVVHDGVDVTDAQAVRHAIRDEVWTDEGHAERMVQSKAEPLDADSLREYQRVSKRISRLAKDIVDAPVIAAEKVAPRVPKAAQAAMDAFLAAYGKDVMREAAKRSTIK